MPGLLVVLFSWFWCGAACLSLYVLSCVRLMLYVCLAAVRCLFVLVCVCCRVVCVCLCCVCLLVYYVYAGYCNVAYGLIVSGVLVCFCCCCVRV